MPELTRVVGLDDGPGLALGAAALAYPLVHGERRLTDGWVMGGSSAALNSAARRFGQAGISLQCGLVPGYGETFGELSVLVAVGR